MRTIPPTMATQHPDNAMAPPWNMSGNPFVSTQEELRDCLYSYRALDIPEYMWDWEGKYADASIVDKLYTESHDYFTRHQLGVDRFLTFRLPNIWEEKGYSLLQAMMVMLSAEDFAKDLAFSQRPLFEVILPMTVRAEQLMHMHYLFSELARFKNRTFNSKGDVNQDVLELIPLVEGVKDQQAITPLLTSYIDSYTKLYKQKPSYMRPFIAASDPALSSGWLAARLANLDALSHIEQLSLKTGIPMYPIIGAGSLPFRGGNSPKHAGTFTERYPGVRTVTLQSSFRFDHSQAQVKRAVQTLTKDLPHSKAQPMDKSTTLLLRQVATMAEAQYRKTLQGIIADIQPVFAAVPKRRERRMHIGLLAYGRSLGELKMPRAITFTAGLYSLGVPPELIGLGRTLRESSSADMRTLQESVPHLTSDIELAGRYINRENLSLLSKRNKAWAGIVEDIEAVEELLGLQLGPRTHAEKSHRNITSNVLLMKNNQKALTRLIEETAILRKSLG